MNWYLHQNTGYEQDSQLDDELDYRIAKLDKQIMSEKQLQDIEKWLTEEEE